MDCLDADAANDFYNMLFIALTWRVGVSILFIESGVNVFRFFIISSGLTAGGRNATVCHRFNTF